MRKRFDQQLKIGQLPIHELHIHPKSKNALDQIVAALKEIYCNREYNEKVFLLLERMMKKRNVHTGRPGMDLWSVFVLSQVRLCLNCSYDTLHHHANNDYRLRFLLGIEQEAGFDRIEFDYQNIYDNVSLLSDDILIELNEIIVGFAHEQVFKKKETTALHLKTDSFVVESNVHFPTDYNLLWDCLRKVLDAVSQISERHHLPGWRKHSDWRLRLKSLMRKVGRVSSCGGKNKQERIQTAVANYLSLSETFLEKVNESKATFPVSDTKDLFLLISLEQFMDLAYKLINLLERRVIKAEQIAHEQKLFSVFEMYTEWITKGKLRPNVELGKKVAITTDQHHLIVHHKIMNHEQDRDIVTQTADILLSKYTIESWSFDKGFWNRDNRDLLRLEIPLVVMPKPGKLTAEERGLETSPMFRKTRNKHSAIESNINELEHRGLDRCPDKGYARFKSYVASSICAYNLKKIGKKILENRYADMQRNRIAA